MTYLMSWERKRDAWSEYESDNPVSDFDNDLQDEDFLPTPDFDPLEILQDQTNV